MKRNRLPALLVAAAFALVSANAAAQTLRRQDVADVDRSRRVDAYGYTFSDDVLAAGILGGQLAHIVVNPRAMRATLIRPRTQFVTELLKSVEAL